MLKIINQSTKFLGKLTIKYIKLLLEFFIMLITNTSHVLSTLFQSIECFERIEPRNFFVVLFNEFPDILLIHLSHTLALLNTVKSNDYFRYYDILCNKQLVNYNSNRNFCCILYSLLVTVNSLYVFKYI